MAVLSFLLSYACFSHPSLKSELIPLLFILTQILTTSVVTGDGRHQGKKDDTLKELIPARVIPSVG